MAYAQWVTVTIHALGTTLSVRNATLTWGKFYQSSNKDAEIAPEEINKITIPNRGQVTISSCGRSDAASGTEGHFDLYDGDTHIGTYYWDCPWGRKTNEHRWTRSASFDYVTELSGGNTDSGALGDVTIRCAKMG